MKKHYFLTQKDHKSPKGIRELKEDHEIANYILKNNYSAGYYYRNYRKDKYFRKSNILIFDIDDPQPNNKSMTDIYQLVKKFKHVITTTSHHGKEKNGVVCDRYRLFIFAENEIKSKDEYKSYINKFENEVEIVSDRKTHHPSHYFKKSVKLFSDKQTGKLLNYKFEKSKSPKCVKKEWLGYVESDICLPESISHWICSVKVKKKSHKKREKLIRSLVAQSNLLYRNVIPQKFLSDFIGVNRETLSNWLKDLIKTKRLILMNDLYFPGKAMDYKAVGDLREAIMLDIEVNGVLSRLPTKIANGEWHDVIWKAAWHFRYKTYCEYLNWVESIPTYFEKPDRALKPKDAWENMHRILRNGR